MRKLRNAYKKCNSYELQIYKMQRPRNAYDMQQLRKAKLKNVKRVEMQKESKS